MSTDLLRLADEAREYSRLFPAPERITWYHAGEMLRAEAGRLRYDAAAYPVHGVSGNAMHCLWHGLLADGPGGMVLTALGQALLAEWKATPEGRAMTRD